MAQHTTYARQLRTHPTDAERRLWGRLRRRQFAGHKFRRQQPLGPYIVDFVCFDQKLVIEVDGGQHVLQVAYDTTRTAWLESEGFRVLRFWDNQVLTETEAVVGAISKAIEPGVAPPP